MIKAVVTAAGRGVRLLPMTKEMPKEMMPVFYRVSNNQRIILPLLQLIFEQIYSCGIRDYCMIVGRGKRSIEDHFTVDHNFYKTLAAKNKDVVRDFYNKLDKSNLVWINQDKPEGFGDAVRRAEKFVGNDDCVVHAGDVSIIGKPQHVIQRLISTGKNSSAAAVLLFRKVKDPERHGVPKVKKIAKSLYVVEEVEEKPERPQSSYGLMPLYYFNPRIFWALDRIKRGRGNEFQLTDAIQKLIENGEKVVGITVNSNEKALDVGTVESFREAQEYSYRFL